MKNKIKKNKIKYSKLKSLIEYFKGPKQADSGLIIIFGNRGSGKSTDIAKDELLWEKGKKGFKQYTDFYSNVKINTTNEHYHYLDLINYKLTDYMPINEKTTKGNCYTRKKDDYGNIVEPPFYINENSVIELDELGIIAHSRSYKTFPQEFVNLVKYLRKLGILMKGNSQSYDIDKTLRTGASGLRLKRKYFHISVSRRINQKIIFEGNKKEKYKVQAEEQIHDELSLAPIFQKQAIQFTYIPFYTGRFNSYE